MSNNNSKNDLTELQHYLKKKYNINVFLNKSGNINVIKKIEYVYLLLLFLIIFTLLIFVFYNVFKKYITKIRKNNLFINIIFYILLIGISLYVIFLFQKYFFMIYFYNKYKNNNIYEESSINYNDIDFETGDILQEYPNWTSNYGFFLYLYQLDFFHNIFIIKFKNKNYVLHYTITNFGYPENILSFNNTKYIEIFLLEDYLRDNYYSTKYYRVFKTNKILDNDKIFTFLKNLKMNDLKFSFFPKNENNLNKNTNTNNCITFILKILNYCSILKKFNIYNFKPDDLIYLPELSNNFYDKPFLMKV